MVVSVLMMHCDVANFVALCVISQIHCLGNLTVYRQSDAAVERVCMMYRICVLHYTLGIIDKLTVNFHFLYRARFKIQK